MGRLVKLPSDADPSKPFYCCTTLKSDGWDTGNHYDEGYFSSFLEAKEAYEKLEEQKNKYVWFAELGFPRDKPKEVADWIYFRTNCSKAWDSLAIPKSLRNTQAYGFEEKNNWKSVCYYDAFEGYIKKSSLEKP